MYEPTLHETIATELRKLEHDNEIVICTNVIGPIVERLVEAVLNVVPATNLTPTELYGVRRLIMHAAWNKKFFDWEMPTLTGYTADEFLAIAEKLPRD